MGAALETQVLEKMVQAKMMLAQQRLDEVQREQNAQPVSPLMEGVKTFGKELLNRGLAIPRGLADSSMAKSLTNTDPMTGGSPSNVLNDYLRRTIVESIPQQEDMAGQGVEMAAGMVPNLIGFQGIRSGAAAGAKAIGSGIMRKLGQEGGELIGRTLTNSAAAAGSMSDPERPASYAENALLGAAAAPFEALAMAKGVPSALRGAGFAGEQAVWGEGPAQLQGREATTEERAIGYGLPVGMEIVARLAKVKLPSRSEFAKALGVKPEGLPKEFASKEARESAIAEARRAVDDEGAIRAMDEQRAAENAARAKFETPPKLPDQPLPARADTVEPPSTTPDQPQAPAPVPDEPQPVVADEVPFDVQPDAPDIVEPVQKPTFPPLSSFRKGKPESEPVYKPVENDNSELMLDVARQNLDEIAAQHAGNAERLKAGEISEKEFKSSKRLYDQVQDAYKEAEKSYKKAQAARKRAGKPVKTRKADPNVEVNEQLRRFRDDMESGGIAKGSHTNEDIGGVIPPQFLKPDGAYAPDTALQHAYDLGLTNDRTNLNELKRLLSGSSSQSHYRPEEAATASDLFRKKYDAQRRMAPIEVAEPELDIGDLVYRNGEWHKVTENTDDGLVLKDGKETVLGYDKSIPVDVVIKADDELHPFAVDEFKAQEAGRRAPDQQDNLFHQEPILSQEAQDVIKVYKGSIEDAIAGVERQRVVQKQEGSDTSRTDRLLAELRQEPVRSYEAEVVAEPDAAPARDLEAELAAVQAEFAGVKKGTKQYREIEKRETKLLNEINSPIEAEENARASEYGLPSNVVRALPAEPQAQAPSKPTTIDDMYKSIEKATGTPVRIGKFRQHKALGIFKVRENVQRQRDYKEVNVAAHEFGHALHDFTLNSKITNIPKAVKQELSANGKALYGERKPVAGYTREGFAEYIAQRLMGDTVETSLPETHKWFEQSVLPANKDFAQRFADTEALYVNWRNQGAEARVRAQIHKPDLTPVGRAKKGLDALMKNWRSALVESGAPLERAVAEFAKRKGISVDDIESSKNPYKVFRALRMGAKGTAKTAITEGVVSHNFEIVGPSLKNALIPVKDKLEDWVAYAVARRAVDLNRRGINSGFDDVDARYVVQKYDTPEFRRALDEVTKWNEELLTVLVDAGSLSDDAAKAIMALNPVYVPFQRYFGDDALKGSQGSGGGKGISDTPQGVYKIKGSGRPVEDIIHSMVRQAEKTYALSNKMAITRAIIDLAESNDKSGWFAEKIPAPQQQHTFSMEKIKKQLEEAGIDLADADTDTLLTVFTDARRYTGKDNTVMFWRDGKPEFWEVNADVYRSLQETDPIDIGPMMRIASMPKRGVQLGATGLSASFGLAANPVRDAIAMAINSVDAKRTPFGIVKGLRDEFNNTPNAKRFRAAGLEMTGMMAQDAATIERFINESLAQTKGEKAKVAARHPIDTLREFLGTFENTPRVAEFKTALEQAEAKYGAGSRSALIEAMIAAKDVTTDFTRAGTIIRAMNHLVPFLNAQTQGTSKLYRQFSGKNAVPSAMKAGAYITIPTMLLWWLNKDEDWYKDKEPWEKYSYWYLSENFRVPRPYGLGQIFGSVPEGVLNGMYAKDPHGVSDAFYETFKSIIPVRSVWDLTPTILKPWLEAGANYNSFTQRPIVNVFDEMNRMPEDQFSRYTTETSKAIGKAFNVSPAKVEHVIGGWTGGMAPDIARTLETLTGLREDSILSSPKDIPVVAAFTSKPDQSRSLGDLYKEQAELKQKAGSDKITPAEKKRLDVLNKVAKVISTERKKVDGKTVTQAQFNKFAANTARGVMMKGQ